ncbi:MAG TPA: hypothetical protein ACQGQH_07795 [Xylella sp.]
MSDGEIETKASHMTIGKGLGIYTMLLVGLMLLIKIAHAITWFPGAIPFCGYFIFGFIMNRLVLRRLIEWHPVYNTLENVSSSKLSALILWPISYPILFVRLVINKHL